MMKKIKNKEPNDDEIKTRDRFVPVSKKQFIIVVNRLMDIIDGLIDENKYHSTIEMSMVKEIEKLKQLTIQSDEDNKTDNNKDYKGVEYS